MTKFFANLMLPAVFLFSLAAYNQPVWAPAGSIWYYSVDETPMAPPPHNYGYYKIESLGDTNLLGITARILKNTYYSSSGQIADMGIEIMYSDTDRVYHFNYDQFNVLYDFSLQPGDTFKIKEPFFTQLSADTTIAFVVDSIGTEEINGQNLRVQYNRLLDAGSGWFTGAKVIERIGDVNYLFPNHQLDCDAGNCPFLHCYSDGEIAFSMNPEIACDTLISGLGSAEFEIETVLFPNPADGFVNLRVPDEYQAKDYSLKIYNELFCILLEMKSAGNEMFVDVSALPSGLYFVQLLNSKKQIFSGKIFIQH
jgi:hypothetical protein